MIGDLWVRFDATLAAIAVTAPKAGTPSSPKAGVSSSVKPGKAS